MDRLSVTAPPAERGATCFEPHWAATTEILLDGLALKGFAVAPNALPEEFLDDLTREAADSWHVGDYRSAGVGREGDRAPEIRTDRILWIDPLSPTALQARYLHALDHLREAIRRELFLPVHQAEAHFAVYPVGSFYRRHLDQFRQAPHRLVSCLLYLNRDWQPEDGGQLRLYTGNLGAESHLDVYPEHGTFVCFLSDRIEHEVLPTRRPRVSLAGWLRRRAMP